MRVQQSQCLPLPFPKRKQAATPSAGHVVTRGRKRKRRTARIGVCITSHHGTGCECTTSSTHITVLGLGLPLSHRETVLVGFSHYLQAAGLGTGQVKRWFRLGGRQQDFHGIFFQDFPQHLSSSLDPLSIHPASFGPLPSCTRRSPQAPLRGPQRGNDTGFEQIDLLCLIRGERNCIRGQGSA